MFDAKKLLDTLLASASEGTAQAREKTREFGASEYGSGMRDVFGQATDGVKEGATRVNEKTGAGDALNDLLKQFGGGNADELLDQAKGWAGDNKMAAGGILGGLGALLAGTRTGRGVATSAVKLGGLALIAGLAYKAYQNHLDGKPLITSRNDAPVEPPSGSGYEIAQLTNNDAQLYVRAMISAATADGHIDAAEREAIMGGIRSAGMTEDAAKFLEDEFTWPASVEDLADGVNSQEQATQVYTAARMSIDADNADERDFLTRLANQLNVDPGLAAHIEAEVQGVRV